jgi:hypothetical protein
MKDHHNHASLLTAMLQKAALAESPSEPPAPILLKSTDDALTALQKLHPAKSLLLLSPYLRTSQNIDPFEALGRGIERHHPRIRHVPYVPSTGMTVTHQRFLEAADSAAVVVVVTGGGEEREMGEFAREAWDIAEEYCPMILVLVDGGDGAERSCGFGTVVSCTGYRGSTLREVADLIFGA